MKTWIRKLRGIVGIGAVWGIPFMTLGFAIGVLAVIGDVLPLSQLAPVILRFGVLGFLLGGGFAGVLTLADGRKTFEELTPGRAALWGALTGASLITVWGLYWMGVDGFDVTLARWVSVTGVYAALTAGLGAGTVALAKRDPARLGVLDERPLLGGARQIGPIWRNEKSGSSARSNQAAPTDQ